MNLVPIEQSIPKSRWTSYTSKRGNLIKACDITDMLMDLLRVSTVGLEVMIYVMPNSLKIVPVARFRTRRGWRTQSYRIVRGKATSLVDIAIDIEGWLNNVN